MTSVLIAVIAMAFRDSVVTLLTVAQSRGKGTLAGLFGAVGDIANAFVTLTAAGYVIQHGWSVQAGVIFVAILITSFFSTRFWTIYGRRWSQEGEAGVHDHPESHVPELARRIAALEQKVDPKTDA